MYLNRSMDYKEFFKGKKVTQMGLGLLGRGLNDAIFMLENGVEDLIVTDKKTAEELAPSVEKLKGYKNLRLVLGEHRLEDFENRDFILKGAGIPLDSEFIARAKEKGIPIEMDSSLFCKLLPLEVKVVGVTGTRGKSTTTHLINHILKTAGKKTILGGNIRDMATLPHIKGVIGDEIVVLELDSWQLQGFGESHISPHIAVFTTFMDDHLNYYGGDREKYFDDKANIFKFQNENDFLVLGEDLDSRIINHKSKKIIARRSVVPRDWDVKLIGEHNLLNIACAVEACKALGISEEKIREGVESFGGVEGRLQFVKEVNGIKIYNDNNATTPEATLAALASLQELRISNYELGIKNSDTQKNIVLLCGGADKNISLNTVAEKINEVCKKVVLLKGEGSEKLKPLLKDFVEVVTFEEGVKKAYEFCEKGDNLLFSPAFSSKNMFNNEYERNDLFLDIVNRL